MFTAICKHQILLENFTKQKMTSSKWLKTIVINKTNMKLLIVMPEENITHVNFKVMMYPLGTFISQLQAVS